MTVKEYIEQLSKFDSDAEITFSESLFDYDKILVISKCDLDNICYELNQALFAALNAIEKIKYITHMTDRMRERCEDAKNKVIIVKGA